MTQTAAATSGSVCAALDSEGKPRQGGAGREEERGRGSSHLRSSPHCLASTVLTFSPACYSINGNRVNTAEAWNNGNIRDFTVSEIKDSAKKYAIYIYIYIYSHALASLQLTPRSLPLWNCSPDFVQGYMTCSFRFTMPQVEQANQIWYWFLHYETVDAKVSLRRLCSLYVVHWGEQRGKV